VSDERRRKGRRQLAALLFEPGKRPGPEALAALAAKGGYTVTLQEAGWAELLRDGLTFDLEGMAPGPARDHLNVRHRYGLPTDFDVSGLEAVSLTPGPHLAGAEHLLPVVRVATALLLELAALPGLAAISWVPAANLLSPEWFGRAAGAWLEGGPFPAFGLASLAACSDGGVRSEGLRFLAGREFRVDRAARQPMPPIAIAVRLLDWLVAHGTLEAPCEVELAGVGPVWLDLDPDGTISARCL